MPAPPAIARFGIGAGAGKLGGPEDYATFLQFYTSPGATLIDQTGYTQPWTPAQAYGGTMFSGYLLVPHGTTRTIRLHYIVPPIVFCAAGGQRFSLVAPRQPESHPDRIRVQVEHGGDASSWTINHPVLDWKATIPIDSRAFHPIPLPILPRSTVPPGHLIESHANLGVPNARD